jgi:hypothetical protein
MIPDDLRRASAREWTDEVEAVAGLLGAAGVLRKATAQRRRLARELVRRKGTASDVLAWLVHGLNSRRGAGWLTRAILSDPEVVWKARGQGAPELVAGPIDAKEKARIDALVAGVVKARGVAATVGEHGKHQVRRR